MSRYLPVFLATAAVFVGAALAGPLAVPAFAGDSSGTTGHRRPVTCGDADYLLNLALDLRDKGSDDGLVGDLAEVDTDGGDADDDARIQVLRDDRDRLCHYR